MKIIFILNFDKLINKKKKQTMFWVVCLVLFVSGGTCASTTTQTNETKANIPQSDRLYNDLMKDFNKYVRPTEVSPVTVNVTFFLVGIKEFDEVNGMFSVTGFFSGHLARFPFKMELFGLWRFANSGAARKEDVDT